ncbi:MAG: hypothetical protein ACRDYF_15820 [Acidimicrobiia bacterium]
MAAVAERQEGAVSMKQLGRAGLSERQARAWVRHERLGRTAARGVFRMPGAEPTWKQALWVAILAGPKATVASHLSAAALRGLLAPPELPHVTVPRAASGRFAGAVVHHATVAPADRCRFNRVPTTGVARTIVDCAILVDQATLDGLVDAAIGRGLTTYRKVRAARARAGPVRAADRLAAALAPYTGGAEPRSEKEAHILRVFYCWGLPPPVTQHVIRDENGRFLAKVDFAWPAWRFGLEYKGDEFHPPRAWARDDRRLARIEAVAWRIEESDRFDLRPSSTRLRTLLTDVLGQPPSLL